MSIKSDRNRRKHFGDDTNESNPNMKDRECIRVYIFAEILKPCLSIFSVIWQILQNIERER